MNFITPEELRVAFESFAAQINRANDAHTRNNEIQTLLTMETTEMLLAAVQTVNLDLHTLVGTLIQKGILTGEEWQYKQAETAAAIQIETAVDPGKRGPPENSGGHCSTEGKARRDVETRGPRRGS